MSGEPKTLTPPWQAYRRKGYSEMRPYVPGEDLTGISVSEADRATMAEDARWGMVTGGYIARNPKNHADQWYVAQAYADKNLEPLSVVARDEAAEAKPIGWDDVADEDVMAALVKAQTEANVLKRAVREWVAADAAYSEWMALPVREDWTSGEAKARKERLEVAEAELRRLAGGENEE